MSFIYRVEAEHKSKSPTSGDRKARKKTDAFLSASNLVAALWDGGYFNIKISQVLPGGTTRVIFHDMEQI